MVIKKNKVLAIIQARYDSTRFPGKVLKKINNQSIFDIVNKSRTRSFYKQFYLNGRNKGVNGKYVDCFQKRTKLKSYNLILVNYGYLLNINFLFTDFG